VEFLVLDEAGHAPAQPATSPLAIPLKPNEGWRPMSPAKEHARPK